jgi:FkbM family methyltransferase
MTESRLKASITRILPQNLAVRVGHAWHVYNLRNLHEPEEDLVRSVVKSGDYCIDVGANIGTFTKLFSECVGVDGRVFSFEPMPQTFDTLSAVIRSYKLTNASAHCCAVSDHEGKSWMNLARWPSGRINFYQCSLSSIAADASTDGTIRPEVEMITIDSLNLPRVNFMKIDVEGHELEVLRGAEQVLCRFRPYLLVEVTSPKTVEYLSSLGYALKRATDSNQFFTFSGAALDGTLAESTH